MAQPATATGLPTPYSDPLRFEGAAAAARSRLLLVARRAVVRLLTHVLPLMLAVTVGAFLLIHSAKGSVVDVMTSEMQLSDPATIAHLNAVYGLDQPLLVQLLRYIWSVARLDLGFSYRQGMSVVSAIMLHLPATLLLMAAAILVAASIGILGGVAASRRPNGWLDRSISVAAVMLFAAPSFWLGILLVVLFSVHLGWTPVGDMRTIGLDDSPLANLLDLLHHLALPALALGLHKSAIYLRVTRNAMIGTGRADFVRTARAKGLTERAITFRHVLRNAMIPVVTVIGLQFATVLSGSIVVEAVFNWPGLGGLLFDSAMARDYPLVLGIVIIGSTIVILVNLLVDLVYTWLDPRMADR
ncbi:ABC transporter permease [Sphingomonas sp. AP4-R1]|uniref:ABC transporter permease n=1 Tax=Sphingomonas sp. AP4-R1 TaxID=2735134 RepID=UPI0014933117|nr:ABC transporter permease [Sphingomonas sp. AP4-R1]QJU57360.1 ABC transporter permease [Sphingomonas sp. AP4-R1]